MDSFANKVVLVTGAGRGIGRACALAFAQRGADVVVSDVAVDSAEQVVAEIEDAGGRAVAVALDVSKADDIAHALSVTIEEFGRLDVLHNNAGIHETSLSENATSFELEDDLWTRVIDINLKGTWMCSKYAVPHLAEDGGGVIVNAASIGGLVGYPMGSAYGPSKAGVVQLTRVMALELAEMNIRVNCYAPGNTDTPMVSEYYSSAPPDQRDYLMRQMIDTHLLHRLGRVEEIANVVLFLAGEESSFMTGSCVTVDGGTLAWRGVQDT